MKQCLKNYVHMLRYVLVVLGVMFICTLIGSSVMFNGINETLHFMTDTIKEITNDSDLSFDRVRDAIANSFNDIGKDQVAESVSKYQVENDMTETIDEALSGVVDNYTEYASEILKLIGSTVLDILAAIAVAIVIQIVGIFVAGDLVYYYSRRDIDKKNLFLLFLERLLGNVVSIVILFLIAFALMYFTGVGILLIVIYPFAACFGALLAAWGSLGKKRVAFGKVVNFKNFLVLIGSSILIIIGSLILGFIIYNYIGIITATNIFIALMIVTKECTRINAYVLANTALE